MEDFTTVAVRRSTLQRLRGFREYRRESYDETLNKMIAVLSMRKSDSEGELNEETRKEIEEGLREARAGKGMSTRELMKRLGIE